MRLVACLWSMFFAGCASSSEPEFSPQLVAEQDAQLRGKIRAREVELTLPPRQGPAVPQYLIDTFDEIRGPDNVRIQTADLYSIYNKMTADEISYFEKNTLKRARLSRENWLWLMWQPQIIYVYYKIKNFEQSFIQATDEYFYHFRKT